MRDRLSDTCMSGGAKGADLAWGEAAKVAGHKVIHWSFKGHYTTAPREEVAILSPHYLLAADPALLSAAPKLKKSYRPGRDPSSKDSFVANLLRRNWYQVTDADAVYAISTIKDGIVQGGTAWAVQMFIDLHKGEACNAYVFDQDTDEWFVWDGRGWAKTEAVPQPKGLWAGIGTRNLLDSGKNAIRRLMG